MHKLVIGAPFGNYLRWPGTVPTLGTYTLHHRAGFWRRLWRVLSTVRYYSRTQSWVNKLGLPNPGITSLKEVPSDAVLSIHGFSDDEWMSLVRMAIHLNVRNLEFNISCPNVARPSLDEVLPAVSRAVLSGMAVVAKLPPIRWMQLAEPLIDAGVGNLHLCNTISSPGGGISGKVLKQYSLWAVEEVKAKWPSVTVIGGGGVTSVGDALDYLNAGADNVSIASMLFNPFNWKTVPVIREALELYGTYH